MSKVAYVDTVAWGGFKQGDKVTWTKSNAQRVLQATRASLMGFTLY